MFSSNLLPFCLSWLYLNKWQKKKAKRSIPIIINVVNYCGIYSHIYRCSLLNLGIIIGLTEEKETLKTLKDLRTFRI